MRVCLTDMFLKKFKLPDGKDREQIYDTKVTGLSVRVTKNVKSFYHVYTMCGEKRHKKLLLGTYPSLSVKQAREIVNKNKALVAANTNPADTRTSLVKGMRVKEVVNEFWEQELSKRKSGLHALGMLSKDVVSAWGDRAVSGITRRDAVLLFDKIRQRGPVIGNRLQSLTVRLFNFACERGIITTSPLVNMKKEKEKPRKRVLEPRELKIFWESVGHADLCPQIVVILKLILLTAQRPGEVASMRWDEINLQKRIWVIPAEKAKNGEEHKVPLSTTVMELLFEMRAKSESDEYVFPSPKVKPRGEGVKEDINQPITRHAVSRAVNRKCNPRDKEKRFYKSKKWDIAHFVPHDLRRTARTGFSAIGVDRNISERIMNHVQPPLDGVYDQYDYLDEKRNALELWAKSLDRVVEGVATSFKA